MLASILRLLLTGAICVGAFVLMWRAINHPSASMTSDPSLRAFRAALGLALTLGSLLIIMLEASGRFDPFAWSFGEATLYCLAYVLPAFIVGYVAFYVRFSSTKD